MLEVTLTPLTEDDRHEFFREEIANYADQQIRDAGWPRRDALERARAEFTPVLEREFAEAVELDHWLWSAKAPLGRSVGWLWVKPTDGMPETSVYLEQITVAADCRRQGYGRAMLAALEDVLAARGVEEVRLHVYLANESARALYAAAGYEELGRNDTKVHLRKGLLARSEAG
jgi:ribosomal protein S18 acetylase RimI-like enzyme